MIKENSHHVLMYFAGRELIPLDGHFQVFFAGRNYPKNIATSIIETCIFNKNLESSLVSAHNLSQKIKL